MRDLAPDTQIEHFIALRRTVRLMLRRGDYGHQTEFLDRVLDQCEYALHQLREMSDEEQKELED